MTYEAILQRTPGSDQAGNREAAGAFVAFLTQVIEADPETFKQLSRTQQTYLYRLREKWKVRAAGNDERWNVSGSRPGRPVAKVKKPRKSRTADPGEKDPLFQSLMRKYGMPRTFGG